MRKKSFIIMFLLIVELLSITACQGSHSYSLAEIQEKTGIEDFKSHNVRIGSDKETVTYYYSMDSDSEYFGVSFYLFDTEKEARTYYEHQQKGYFESLDEEGEDYVIGEIALSDASGKGMMHISDNLVIMVPMSVTYYSEEGTARKGKTLSRQYVDQMIREW